MQKIVYQELKELVDAYIYGTATPISWLINKLKLMSVDLKSGKQYIIVLNNADTLTLTEEHFDKFILKYFDDFILQKISK